MNERRKDGAMVSAIAIKFSSTTADWQQAWARYRPRRASDAPAIRPTPIPSSMMRVASELQGAAVPKKPLLTKVPVPNLLIKVVLRRPKVSRGLPALEFVAF